MSNEKVTLQIFTNYFESHLYTDPDESIAKLHNILNNDRYNKNEKLISSANYYLGMTWYHKGNFNNALKYFELALYYALKENPKDKSLLSNLYANIGSIYYFKANYDDALSNFHLAYKNTIINNNNLKDFAVIFNNIASVYYILGDHSNSILFYDKAMRINRKLNNLSGIANGLNNLASLYDELGVYEISMLYYYQALEYSDSIENKKLKSTILNNLGSINKNLLNYDKSLGYYQASMKIKNEINNQSAIANTLNNIGLIHQLTNKPDSAEIYYLRAYEIFKEIGSQYGLGVIYNNLGKLQEEKGNLNQALFYFNKAYKNSIVIKDKRGQTKELINLGRTYQKLKKSKQSLLFLDSALNISTKHNFFDLNRDIEHLQYQAYEDINQAEQAIKHLVRYSNLNDSLISSEKLLITEQLEIKYKTKQQEQTIHELANINKIAKQEANLNQISLQKRKNTIWGLTIIIILISSTLFLLFNQHKLKHWNKQIEMEQQFLRAQMDPHFISNALASIQHFVLKNEPQIASDYLARFSELMRNIIISSRNKFISISLEIKLIETYLDLQQLRMSHGFTYEILLDNRIDPDSYSIPPMLIQPIIENSIKHAFQNKTKNNKIKIEITESLKSIIIFIHDNGIGIENSPQIKNSNSFGTKIIKERIKNLNYSEKSGFQVILDNSTILEGTRIKIVIPKINYDD
ncbi:MAG: tetratricopeptide repeat protein [Bacteroidota bacterium]|nr:tetratricopeptide repeat protein [Bacteroidota bacterium]